MSDFKRSDEAKEPVGAIWVKNWRLKQGLLNWLNTRQLNCPHCQGKFHEFITEGEINEVLQNHIMTVKVKSLSEKFIAIYNSRKRASTHPDYFLHVYMESTGSPAVYPFPSSTTQSSLGDGEIKEVGGEHDTSRTTVNPA